MSSCTNPGTGAVFVPLNVAEVLGHEAIARVVTDELGKEFLFILGSTDSEGNFLTYEGDTYYNAETGESLTM